MTEQQFAQQTENGGTPYRHPRAGRSADGQAASIRQAYSEHLLQTNDKWLVMHFPNVRRSLDFFMQQWDADRDGQLSGGQHTTLDYRSVAIALRWSRCTAQLCLP